MGGRVTRVPATPHGQTRERAGAIRCDDADVGSVMSFSSAEVPPHVLDLLPCQHATRSLIYFQHAEAVYLAMPSVPLLARGRRGMRGCKFYSLGWAAVTVCPSNLVGLWGLAE